MAKKLILTGDINLMNVADPSEPFRKIINELQAADVVFGNLECCLHLPPSRHSHENEGFFADPVVGCEALKFAGIHAVGIANNVNYGASNIAASIARLDEVGLLQDHEMLGYRLARHVHLLAELVQGLPIASMKSVEKPPPGRVAAIVTTPPSCDAETISLIGRLVAGSAAAAPLIAAARCPARIVREVSAGVTV